VEDHFDDAMWLGPSYPLSHCWGDSGWLKAGCLNAEGGDPPQYPALKLGYNAPKTCKSNANNGTKMEL